MSQRSVRALCKITLKQEQVITKFSKDANSPPGTPFNLRICTKSQQGSFPKHHNHPKVQIAKRGWKNWLRWLFKSESIDRPGMSGRKVTSFHLLGSTEYLLLEAPQGMQAGSQERRCTFHSDTEQPHSKLAQISKYNQPSEAIWIQGVIWSLRCIPHSHDPGKLVQNLD